MNGKQPPTKTQRSARRPLRPLADLARSTLCVLCLISYSSIAGAVSDEERAGARAAANAGLDAIADQRWQDAIGYFQKAESIVHAPPHLLNIARAHEKLGQLVEAREAYLKVVREELPADAPKAFRQAQADARSELAALEPRVPRVSVVVQGAGELPVKVHMNGNLVPDGLVGVPRPLNPGSYEFQAFAEGARSNPSTLVLREGAAETMVLTLRATTAPAPAPLVVPSAALSAEPSTEQRDTGHGGSSGMRIASYVSMGVGVIGLGVGTGFAVRAANKHSQADDICSFTGAFSCPISAREQVLQLDSEGDKARTVSIIGFVAGGVGIATGVTLFVLSSKGSSGSQKASVMPWIGLNSAGLRGRF